MRNFKALNASGVHNNEKGRLPEGFTHVRNYSVSSFQVADCSAYGETIYVVLKPTSTPSREASLALQFKFLEKLTARHVKLGCNLMAGRLLAKFFKVH